MSEAALPVAASRERAAGVLAPLRQSLVRAIALVLAAALIAGLRAGDALADIHWMGAHDAWRARLGLSLLFGALGVVGVSVLGAAHGLGTRAAAPSRAADAITRWTLVAVLAVGCWALVAGAVSRWALRPTLAFAVRVGATLAPSAIVWCLTRAAVRRWGADRVSRRALAAAGALVIAALAFAGSRDAGLARRIAAGTGTFETAIREQRIPSSIHVLLVGIDGVSIDFVEAMAARGELPVLAALRAGGVSGPLRSAEPTWSPSLWSTIASGVPPREHGVRGFLGFWVPGFDRAIVDVPLGFGLGAVVQLASRMGAVDAVPVPSSSCVRPRIWDLVDGAAGRAAVIGWWATTPVTPLHGVMVGDGFWEHGDRAQAIDGWKASLAETVYPPQRADELRALRRSPAAVDDARAGLTRDDAAAAREDAIEERIRVALAMDDTHAAIARKLLAEDEPWNLLAVYLRGVDLVSHAALELGSPLARTSAAGRFGDTVRRYYARTDRLLGELLAAAPPGTVTVVVSDHGFARERDGRFGHTRAPAGVIVVAGPGVEQGARVEDASLLDVFPTLIDLLGLAPASDLSGRSVLTRAERRDAATSRRASVASYGSVVRPARRPAVPAVYGRAIEDLRTLGYVQ